MMSPSCFRIACLMRLGLPIPGLDNFCSCGSALDRYGLHLWSCHKHTAHVLQRHESIVKLLVALATSGGVSTRTKGLTEFMEILPVDAAEAGNCAAGAAVTRRHVVSRADMQRTDILFSGMGDNGERTLCDVSGGAATCATYFGRAAGTAGHVISVIEGKKIAKYQDKCTRVGASFLPFVFETNGRVSDVAIKFMKLLIARAAVISHIPYSMLLSYWMKRLSTVIQTGNAE